MPTFESNHNANLLNTLPAHTPIVNFVDYDEFGEPVEYYEKNAPTKLFVMIDNNINDQGLSLRNVEFYCLLMYLIISYPSTKLSILTIQSLIIKHTNIKINKNSINKYLNILEHKGLVYRSSKFLVAPRISSDRESSFVPKKVSKSNIYYPPKVRFIPFYITAYNHDTVICTLVLELYFASKAYNFHRPSKVCKDLNISRKTYYKLLKELLNKNIITKIELKKYNSKYEQKSKQKFKIFHYKNTNRLRLLEDSKQIQSIRDLRRDVDYSIRQDKIIEQKAKKTPQSRIWYASLMGPIMDKFNINYIPLFNTTNPIVAYKIVQELLVQYKLKPELVTAPLIVAAIKGHYNWINITDRDHAKFKNDQARERNRSWGQREFLELMEG